jgi:hypothetical protein
MWLSVYLSVCLCLCLSLCLPQSRSACLPSSPPLSPSSLPSHPPPFPIASRDSTAKFLNFPCTTIPAPITTTTMEEEEEDRSKQPTTGWCLGQRGLGRIGDERETGHQRTRPRTRARTGERETGQRCNISPFKSFGCGRWKRGFSPCVKALVGALCLCMGR